jgi:hypothetical protein
MRLSLISLSTEVRRLKSSKSSTRGSTSNQQSCLVGAYCGHAVLTKKIGIYRCPFGLCFKRVVK